MREIGMISDLKPYQEIKYSGSKWFEVVPEHWKARTLWSLSRLRVERNPGGLPLLSIFLDQGVIIHKDDGGQTHAPSLDLSNYQVVHPGDFVLNNQQAWRGSVGVSTYHGIISPAYIVLELSEEFLPGFANYVSRCPVMVDQYVTASKGVGDIQRQIYWPYLREVKVPLPPTIEQSAIIRFLDYMDRLIRRYIRVKQKLIRLLEELKQAIIHRAVTRGLDPNVPIKPSGVEWLGDIPEHWDVVSLRRRWMVKDCKHLTVPFFEQGIPLASVREAQSFELRLDSCNRTTEEWYNQLIEGGRRPQIGDLIYCRNVSVGASAIVTQDDVFALGQDVCLIRSTKENQRWFNYYLHSKAMADQLALILVGSTFHRINLEDIKALIVPVPPRFEQDQISNYLDKELKQIEDAIAFCLQQQIILREYRARLISDVVTGKLDVRGVNLPAAEDIEAPEEYTDLPESEEIIEGDLQEEIPAEGD